MGRRYWLFKSEPDVYSITDLREEQRTTWEGVRNYQARNLLRDEVQVGDGVLFYHSRKQPTAVVGTAEVVRAGYPDPTQFDARSRYRDEASSRAQPRWYAVDVAFREAFARPVPLEELKGTPGLEGMALLRKGSRLSVQPVSPQEWRVVCRLGRSRARGGRG